MHTRYDSSIMNLNCRTFSAIFEFPLMYYYLITMWKQIFGKENDVEDRKDSKEIISDNYYPVKNSYEANMNIFLFLHKKMKTSIFASKMYLNHFV